MISMKNCGSIYVDNPTVYYYQLDIILISYCKKLINMTYVLKIIELFVTFYFDIFGREGSRDLLRHLQLPQILSVFANKSRVQFLIPSRISLFCFVSQY